jgi:hypothetical protein
MTEVDFYKLERSVQDRFADATRGIGVPVPLLCVPSRRRAHIAWFAAGAILLAVVTGSALVGVGVLQSPIAIAPLWVLAGLGAGYAFALLCLLRGASVSHRAASRPYRPGLYLFPIGLVDARDEPLRVARLPEIRALEPLGEGALRVEVEAAPAVEFPISGGATAGEIAAALDEARRAHRHALETQNRRELALLDPLMDSGYTSPFSPKLPLRRSAPLWQRLAVPLALIAGAMLGVGVWTVRNRVSERLLYERAVEEDRVETYRTYLARGGPRPEVGGILLPRAELRIAAQAGTVEAIEAYIARHPVSRIGEEISHALHAALDRELAEMRARGSVTALREFRERRGKYPYIEAPTRAALASLYDEALARYVAVSNPAHPEGPEFFAHLLAYAREHGPEVNVQFIRRTPKSVEAADSAVRRSAYFMGNASVPSQYFDEENSARREAELLREVLGRLQSTFPPDILSFTPKEALTVEEDQPPFPEAGAPTMFILSETHMSGGYMSRKPRGVFVGVGLKFLAQFVIPGDSKRLKVETSTWRSPNPNLLKEDGAKIGDVYESMARFGYERFQRKLLETFFAKVG